MLNILSIVMNNAIRFLLRPRTLEIFSTFDDYSKCHCSTSIKPEKSISSGPGLDYFIARENRRKRIPNIFPSIDETHPYLKAVDLQGNERKVKFVTHGCQMNVSDMEIVRSVLFQYKYTETLSYSNADIVLIMTCSIREGAEVKIWNRLKFLASKKRSFALQNRSLFVGVLGCMAERLKQQLLEKSDIVDIVAGPDSYRDLPRLLAIASNTGSSAVNVQLSFDETYADITPVRIDDTSTTAFVSIMRGCDNMCTYCIVPFTRGRERSRPIDSIVDEIRRLSEKGVKQVTLLGQNVNSYRDLSESVHYMNSVTNAPTENTLAVQGFKTVYKPKLGGRPFSTLLHRVSDIDPEMRIRFTSPHPKDFPLEVLQLVEERANLCKQVHLPAQSGNDDILAAMGRGYTRQMYLELVQAIREFVPDVSLTSDFIGGFCGESLEAHEDSLSLIRQVEYTFCYVFPYSMRERTRAHRRLVDDVPEIEKKRRSEELAQVFRDLALKKNTGLIDTDQLVLVEATSKRSNEHIFGRSDGGIKVILDNSKETICDSGSRFLKPGDYVRAKIHSASSQTLQGHVIGITTLKEYSKMRLINKSQ